MGNTPLSNMLSTKSADTEEKKQPDVSIPKPDKAILKKLNKEMAALYKHQCEHKVDKGGSVTFWPTPNLKQSAEKLPAQKISMQSFLDNQNCTGALTYSDPDLPIVQIGGQTCSFLVSALTAWSKHYPFRFKPEHIWLLVLQGVAVHVDQNAEKLRSKYVKHDGKKTLEIEISANPPHEEWVSVVEGFVAQIDKNTVKDTCELFDCDFTCSTITEKLAAKITVMDICKNYFDFRCSTCCGFPQVTIDGTRDDWCKLKDKVTKLLKSKVDKKFGSQWGAALLPLLDRFIAAFDGDIDCVFWNSMIKRGSTAGSGAYSYYCGWINILFPFLDSRWNRYCVPYSMDKAYVEQGFTLHGSGGWGVEAGGDVEDYPTGLASAPVIWNNNGCIIPMKFLAGFVGFIQDPKTLELVPNVAWCVAKAMTDKEIQEKEEKKKKMYGW
eukprot:36911_1